MHTFLRNPDGSCRVYNGEQILADGLTEAAARHVCTTLNAPPSNGGKRRPGIGSALLVLLVAFGVTTCMLRAPQYTPAQLEAAEQFRKVDAELLRQCRLQGATEGQCQALRAENRKLWEGRR